MSIHFFCIDLALPWAFYSGMTEALRLQLLTAVVHDNEAFEAERDSALSRQAKVANGITFTPVRVNSRNTDDLVFPDSPVSFYSISK